MADDALIVKNDLKEALAQLAVIVDLTNDFEDIYSIHIHVVYQRTVQGLVYPARYTFLKGWQSESYIQNLILLAP